ncbi:MAG TPA: hypothetical protein VH561_09560 [Micromonosporaceae bacterium]|jgi:hypothetical protein
MDLLRHAHGLLPDALRQLREVLLDGPGLRLQPCFDDSGDGAEVWWQITSADGICCRMLVEAHDVFSVRTIERLAYLTPASLRQMRHPTVLIVAPWLSPRCRELIVQRGWSYLDLSGNVELRSYEPPIYLRLDGAERDPRPRQAGEVSLRGAQINALVRLLVDATPPYRARELAIAAGLSESYVSRAIRALHEQGLLDRPGSGPIVDVDWAELLRQRAREYRLRSDNHTRCFATRRDPRDLIGRLAGDTDVVVTGAFAAGHDGAARVALYVPDIGAFARVHGLSPARNGGTVLLIEPAARSQVQRCRIVDGVRFAGYSQLAQDLLAEDGHLVDHGDELLAWMRSTSDWRLPQLPPAPGLCDASGRESRRDAAAA